MSLSVFLFLFFFSKAKGGEKRLVVKHYYEFDLIVRTEMRARNDNGDRCVEEESRARRR